MVRVFKQRHFILFSNFNNGYIIHNTLKPFEHGHTHLNNYHTARCLIKVACYHTIPKHLSIYLIDSLIRISTDEDYIKGLIQLKEKEIKNQKKKTR